MDNAIGIVSQACRGLDHAHRNGVVHRDVKPGNLLRSDDGVVKLADFGIAKATEQSSITQVGSVLGTAAYLAPEQARGEEAGPPADQYALGVVTYQMLAGRLPYEATSLTELAFKQQRELPPPLDALNPEVPAGARARGRPLDGARRRRALSERARDGRGAAQRRPGDRAAGGGARRRRIDGRDGDAGGHRGHGARRNRGHARPAAAASRSSRDRARPAPHAPARPRTPVEAREARRAERAPAPRPAFRAASCAG